MSLETEEVYLYPQENSKPHKTQNYELVRDEENPVAILRRGKHFNMAIRFSNRGFNRSTDLIRVIFNFGPKPTEIKGTRGVVKVDARKKRQIDDEQKYWMCNVSDIRAETITLEVFAPPSIPVGIWSLQVQTSVINSPRKPNVYDYPNEFYFLFNPWNCHDMVYMPEERMLDEYVLTDVGKIWLGPYGSTKGREWVFGQFDACVLPAVMLMFEKSGLAHSRRGDPIKVARMISKMVNCNDDEGILVGRWDGEYEDGTAPSTWTGSVPILQEYLDTGSAVRYGQCWVFSGVVTTICRALGIPSRVVSNLASAHGVNAALTVNKYFNSNNEELFFDLNNTTGEYSIWVYHVWNDVYMTRPDLPLGYGGWQAIDATPQETSDGVYQCGPTSLEAIKNGNVGFNYDVAFMMASVSAVLLRWKEHTSSAMGYSKIHCNKYQIGRVLLTKKPFMFDPNGEKDRQDITSSYKSKEGTEAERLALLNAFRGTEDAKILYGLPEPTMEDMEFDLQDIDEIKIGEDFNVVVKIKNKSDKPRHIQCALSISSIYYRGVIAGLIKKEETQFKMEAKKCKELIMAVKAEEYLNKLVEYCNMKISVIATVTETIQTWAEEDDFQVIRPSIKINIPPEIPLGRATTISLRFVNPLNKFLTKCMFSISAPKLLQNQMIHCADVKPGAVVKVNVDVVPQVDGEHKLVATFTSREMSDITGSAKVDVVGDYKPHMYIHI